MDFRTWCEGRSKWLSFEQLTPVQQSAVRESTRNILPLQGREGWWGQYLTDYATNPTEQFQFTVETIPTLNLIDRFAQWGWTQDTLDKDDLRRIRKVMRLPRWPYVSFVARNFKMLNDPFCHGDGYHRAWAAHFNGEPYIEVVYVRRLA